jgi:integrase
MLLVLVMLFALKHARMRRCGSIWPCHPALEKARGEGTHDLLSVGVRQAYAMLINVAWPELKATIARLRGNRKHGYLLHGMRANQNGDRGDHVGKRFGRLKMKLGFGRGHVFHSFRGTVITLFEHLGVAEGTVQAIVGHERSTLTGQTYSGKSTFAMRWDAVQKLSYPVV